MMNLFKKKMDRPEKRVNGCQFNLEAGEILIWQGEMNTTFNAKIEALTTALICIIIAPPVIWWWSEPLHRPLDWSTLLLASLPGAIFATLYKFSDSKKNAKRVSYRLTNKRVGFYYPESLKTRESRWTTQEISLANVTPKIIYGWGNTSTIHFGQQEKKLAFRWIDNAQDIYRLVISAQAELPYPVGENAYYRKNKPVQLIEDRLRSNEYLLWKGEPLVSPRSRQKMQFILVALTLIVFINFDLIAMGMASSTSVGEASGVIMLLSIALFPIISKLRINRMEYCLTSQRVLIIRRWGLRILLSDRELSETDGMRLKRSRNGKGSIVLDRRTKFIFVGHGFAELVDEFAFYDIPDAENVHLAILTARENRSNEISD